jgi:hypothetical protein
VRSRHTTGHPPAPIISVTTATLVSARHPGRWKQPPSPNTRKNPGIGTERHELSHPSPAKGREISAHRSPSTNPPTGTNHHGAAHDTLESAAPRTMETIPSPENPAHSNTQQHVSPACLSSEEQQEQFGHTTTHQRRRRTSEHDLHPAPTTRHRPCTNLLEPEQK